MDRQLKKISKSPVTPFHPSVSLNKDSFKLHDDVLNFITNDPEETAFFLNEKQLRDRVALIRDNFLPNYPQYAHVAYAVKANPRRELLEVLYDEGIECFDCASIGEVETVLESAPDARILFNHPIKRKKEIIAASELGVSHYTAYLFSEIKNILDGTVALGPHTPVEIPIRMRHYNKHALVDLNEKFGAFPEDTKKMIRHLNDNPDVRSGISAHTGSQNESLYSYTTAINQMFDVATSAGGVSTMNVGGGIPVNYFDSYKYGIDDYLSVINSAFDGKSFSRVFNDDPDIFIELGRSIVASSVDLIIPILAVEDSSGEKAVHMYDGIFRSFSDHAVHNWKYNFQTLDENGNLMNGLREPFKLWGCSCDGGDHLHYVNLPKDIKAGCRILVQKAGAYTSSQASGFGGVPVPPTLHYNTHSTF